MIRALGVAAAAALLIGAARPATVDYRLGLDPQKDGPVTASVEIRFIGDADGETKLALPSEFGGTENAWRNLYDLKVQGAQVSGDGAERTLRHRPNAKITVRYRVRSAYAEDPEGADGNPYQGPILRPEWAGLIGEFVFATPAGRDAEAATFRWGKLPKGWQAASDLDNGRLGRPMTVADVPESITLAGASISLAERPVEGGTLRVAMVGSDAGKLADAVAPVVTAERRFWTDVSGPFFVGFIPLAAKPRGYSVGGTGRSDGFALYSTPGQDEQLKTIIAHEHTHTWIPNRIGRLPPEAEEPAVYWLSEGFTDFFTHRALLKAGFIDPKEFTERLDGALSAYEASPVRTAPAARIVSDFWKDRNVQQLPYQRGALLALKWDEDIRLKTGGKADLDTVLRQMRDHYQKFAPGQGPDVVTGFISAAWVVARLDLRGDIERYAVRGELVPLPENLIDGCLYVRTNRKPTFDPGFDTKASFAAKQLKGVRTRGPAWNSGLRNGTRLDSWTLKEGDTQVQVELVTRDARGRARKVAFWPYGDDVIETHDLLLKPGMTAAETVTCAGKMAGL
jgi:predicted metalloprotease with PDZ domain